MKPVSVQVITYAPTLFSHCQHCELAFSEMGIAQRLRQREAAEALPDDLRAEFQVVSDWIHRLLERHGARIRVDVLDAASIRGFAASLRHRVGRYPAVIVDGRETWTGLDFRAPEAAIDGRIAASGTRPPGAAPS
jgi:hypothetical protein